MIQTAFFSQSLEVLFLILLFLLTYYIYNNCKHQDAYNETGMQGVSYTTGVPAMIGAMMFCKGIWSKPGVHNVEEFDPDPFMEQLNKQGLPWHEIFNENLEVD